MANQMTRANARGVTRGGLGAAGASTPASVAGDPERRALADGLHAVAIHLLRRLRREDEAMGLSPARASALSVLVFGGARSLRQLAQAEQVSAPTMSRMVAAMEAAGLVRRRPDPADARGVRIAATARGRRILEAGRARRLERLTALLEGVAAGDQAVLARAVVVLQGLLREQGPPPATGRERGGGAPEP